MRSVSITIVYEMEACSKQLSTQFKEYSDLIYFFSAGEFPIEIHNCIKVAYGKDCIDVTTVHC